LACSVLNLLGDVFSRSKDETYHSMIGVSWSAVHPAHAFGKTPENVTVLCKKPPSPYAWLDRGQAGLHLEFGVGFLRTKYPPRF
jgi:hypothetical protein